MRRERLLHGIGALPWERRDAPRIRDNPPMLSWDPKLAVRHLTEVDERLGAVIERIGPCTMTVHGRPESFRALFRSIVYQQLSGKAAGTIWGRVTALFPRRTPRAAALASIPDADLRAAGMSRGKILAARDLAAKILDGTVPTVAEMKRMSEQEVMEALVAVRGIGPWTAEMYLMFWLGRPDVLPVGDLGVRKGFMIAYGKRKLPTPEALARHGRRWAPYRTAAAWYLWRLVDDESGGEW